jgi:hypothetical protein
MFQDFKVTEQTGMANTTMCKKDGQRFETVPPIFLEGIKEKVFMYIYWFYLWEYRYSVTSWAFYLFPSVGTNQNSEKKILVQLSSFSFLADCSFDFNKVFRQGIPFISRNEEAYLRNQHLGGTHNEKPVLLKEQDQAFYDQIW